MSRLRAEDGFTLTELLVGAQLMVIVMFASLLTLDQFTSMGKRGERRVEAQQEARRAADQMARSLRNIAGDAGQADAIEKSEPYDLVFTALDTDTGSSNGANARNIMRVRYCLDTSGAEGRIRQQVQTWNSALEPDLPSTASCPGTGWDETRLLADHVTNRSGGQQRPVWSYRADGGQISSIRTELWVDDDASNDPAEVSLATGVYLRNQNRAPSASFTATPAGVHHVLLNASGSSDPEGQALEVVWRAGGREIGRGMVFDWNAGSSGSRLIELEVKDPSGLSDATAQTVAVP